MNLKIVEQDLFLVDKKYSLGHCVSYDCKMGKGIALTFRKRYPEMPMLIIKYLNITKTQYPCAISYKIDDDKYIFNLITKEFYYNKPSYNSLRKSLIDLRNKTRTLNVKYLAIPKLGCGLDMLSWKRVSRIIRDVFKDDDIDIIVCYKK